MIFSSENSTVTAGDIHTLQCTVTDIQYLAVSPTVELIGPGDSVLATDMSFTVTYTLDPVMTSHAGQYTCRASVMVASVSVDVSGQSSSTLTVQSELVTIMSTITHVHSLEFYLPCLFPQSPSLVWISLLATLLLCMLVLASLSHVL